MRKASRDERSLEELVDPAVRRDVQEGKITPGQSQALLKLEPEQLSLAEQIKAENLSVRETRYRVREILGKPLKWQLIPIMLDLETFRSTQKNSAKRRRKKADASARLF